MISSIRLDCTTACMHLPGAADTEAFVTYLGEVLCPTLRLGDIVVMDNLAVHKSPQVTALVKAVGAEVRFLPAYSPDLNPIEKMWSKIKSLLRSHEARTPEELDEAISKAFSKTTAKDAMGYFASCGYSIIENDLGLAPGLTTEHPEQTEGSLAAAPQEQGHFQYPIAVPIWKTRRLRTYAVPVM